MAAATLLTDAFNAAVVYWIANAGGTRAGLIAALVGAVGVSQSKATTWVDAITQGSVDVGFTDDPAYSAFKARLVAINQARGIRMTACIFEYLTGDLLLQDAKDEIVAGFNEKIAVVDADIAIFTALRVSVAAEAPGADRDNSLIAIDNYLGVLARRRNAYVRDRDRALAAP